jgi:tetratricopeptide (TPR) repeat protein
MRHAMPFPSRNLTNVSSRVGSVFLPQSSWHDRRMLRLTALILFLAATVPAAAATPNIIARAADKLRYDNCLAEANLNPAAALGAANKWIEQGGGPPAQHCAAVALASLKRYPEAAQKLDELGRAPGVGDLRPSLFDQAGNAWMLAGEISKAVASFQAALVLSPGDADLYGDLARAQAMQADWGAVESDLNAALAISPRRSDLLVLRASARHAENHIADAKADIETSLSLSPKNPDALVERGSIRRDSGDFKGARADFQAALALKPPAQTEDAARRNLAALDMAEKKPTIKPAAKKK